MTRRWPAPPTGPLVAAAVATQTGCWRDALMLWRDIVRHRPDDMLARQCAAEAALRVGHRGIADHMLGQVSVVPSHIRALAESDSSEDTGKALADLEPDIGAEIVAFRETHPLGAALPDDLIVATHALGWRPSFGVHSRMSKVRHVRRELEAMGDRPALKAYVAALLDRREHPDALHWAILALRDAGVRADDPVFRRAIDRFWSAELSEVDRMLADARLCRALGFPAFARIILLQALDLSRRAKERGKIRRRLASLAAERDRWLDDSDRLAAADFAGEAPERNALLQCPRDDVMREPLENAFGWLFESGLTGTAPYAAGEKRLLMVGNTLGCGGMERMLARAYRHFADSGDFAAVDLALLDYADDAPSAFYAKEAGVRAGDVLLLDKGARAAMPFSLLPGSWKARAQKLHDHIAATRPSVVHAWNDLTGLLAAYAGLVAGCPKIIIHFHHAPAVPRSGGAEQIASYPAVYRQLRDRSDIVTVFCAEAAARGYADWWRARQDERFRVLYNGFDWNAAPNDGTAAKTALGLDGDRPVIGTVLRFSEVKQPLLWVDTAIALTREAPDTQFLMVGDGPLRAAAADRFAEAGLAASVHMPGQVENVADYLAAMDLFWLTSRTEGLPNVLIEAQCSGVPIAAFDVGGIGETFIDGETGILVPPNDSAELARRSAALLTDGEWRAAASRAAVEQVEARFSSDSFFDGLRRLYA